jgi:hypothetical protein
MNKNDLDLDMQKIDAKELPTEVIADLYFID